MCEQNAVPVSVRLICRFTGEDSDTEFDLSHAQQTSPLCPEVLLTQNEFGLIDLIVRVNPERDITVVHLSIHTRFSSCFNSIVTGSRSISCNAGTSRVEQCIECDGQPIVLYSETPGRNLVVTPDPHQLFVRAHATLTNTGLAGLKWVRYEDGVAPVSIMRGEWIMFRCRIDSTEAGEGKDARPVEIGRRTAEIVENPRDSGRRFRPDWVLKSLVFASLFSWIAMVATARWIVSLWRPDSRKQKIG